MINIIQLIDEFLRSSEKSLSLADALEVALDDAFPDDDVVQRAVEALAAYRPEGGTYLFDSNTIVDPIVAARSRLMDLKEISN